MESRWVLFVTLLITKFGSSPACVDNTNYASKCPGWKDDGYCDSNSKYIDFMKKNCQKSCQLCTTEECKDDSSLSGSCPGWRDRGYCKTDSSYHSYMKTNCLKTCGFCKTVVKGNCEDSSSYQGKCSIWKGNGFCKENSNYYKFMRENCIKTCELCQNDCQDDSKYQSKCPDFKSRGYCVRGQVYYASMLKFCKKACNLCGEAESKCASGPSGKGRVVGGVEAKPNSWPWQVGLTYDSKFRCGGTLISPLWVLTAAHCVFEKDKSKFEAYFGEHNWDIRSAVEQKRGIASVIVYPNYNLLDNEDDIALMKLDNPVQITDQVNFACLPLQSLSENTVGDLCYITGWGHTGVGSSSSTTLQEANLPVVTNKECEKLNIKFGSGLKLNKGMLCAGYGADFSKTQSGCRGDSGGPLACKTGLKWTVEGVVSWGSSRCYAFEKYTVFTRVSAYKDWIDKYVQ